MDLQASSACFLSCSALIRASSAALLLLQTVGILDGGCDIERIHIISMKDIEILTKPLQRGKFVLDFGEYGINFVAYRLHACGFVEPLRLENLIEGSAKQYIL